mmetsp:Transcript_17351/g.32912  ORF Transcript_17351/g.32912 Transcript_17351/m.32912 type:complete len:369 (-) Transcript_17351:415-1521(-)
MSAVRSSTASHYTKNYETASAGFAEHDFYQVILDNNIWDEPPAQLIGLAVLLAVLVAVQPPSRMALAVAGYWGAVAAVCVTVLPHVTLTPLLTTLVYTRTTYPYMVVIPHCIVAHATYRTQFGNHNTSRLQALVACFFLYGFGGSLVADVTMGLPATAMGHARIVPCHVLGWLLVWFCPLDAVYRAWMTKGSFVRYFMVAAEAVDAVTTPMGRIARAARELQNHTTAPLVAGLLVGTGGAAVRYLTGVGSWEAFEAGFYKTAGYCLLFWSAAVWSCDAAWYDNPVVHHCTAYSGSDLLRVAVVTAHVVWTLLVEMGVGVTGHPFVWMGYQIKRQGAVVTAVLQLGPPPSKTEEAGTSSSSSSGHEKKD